MGGAASELLSRGRPLGMNERILLLTDADSNLDLGNGYFLFLEPRPYPELIGGEYCQDRFSESSSSKSLKENRGCEHGSQSAFYG